jgi:hypothetical protein
VILQVFDIRGRLVFERKLGLQGEGARGVPFAGTGLSDGLYLYRLTMHDPRTEVVRARLNGRMILMD